MPSANGRRLSLAVDACSHALSVLIEAAIVESGKKIVADMQGQVPVDTGALKSTIKMVKTGPIRYAIKAGGAETTKDGYDYALAVEFGNHHSPANPFFYRTYRRNKRGLRRRVRKAIRDGIRQGVK